MKELLLITLVLLIQTERISGFNLPFLSSKKPQDICYGELGCFGAGTGDFRQHSVVPQSPQEIGAEFWFYGPQDTDSSAKMFDYANRNAAIGQIQSNSGGDLFIVIHEYGKKWKKPWVDPLLKALQQKGNNVLLVKWINGAQEPNYAQAAANTRMVGAMLGNIAQSLSDQQKTSLPKITCVGFDLGAHACGFFGKKLPGLKRIIGLDPAGPLFNGVSGTARLDSTDAEIVLGLHTNAYVKKDPWGPEGISHSVGTLDLWANDGTHQPQCPEKHSTTVGKVAAYYNPFSMTDYNPQCSHVKSIEYMTEAILTGVQMTSQPPFKCQFHAFPCRDPMGSTGGSGCFPCNEGANQCRSLNSIVEDKSGLPRGDYTFFTRSGDFQPGQQCGRVYKLELKPDQVNVRGKLLLSVVYQDGTVDNFPLTSDTETVPLQGVAKAYVGLDKKIGSIRILYQPYSGYISALRWIMLDSINTINRTLGKILGGEGHPFFTCQRKYSYHVFKFFIKVTLGNNSELMPLIQKGDLLNGNAVPSFKLEKLQLTLAPKGKIALKPTAELPTVTGGSPVEVTLQWQYSNRS